MTTKSKVLRAARSLLPASRNTMTITAYTRTVRRIFSRTGTWATNMECHTGAASLVELPDRAGARRACGETSPARLHASPTITAAGRSLPPSGSIYVAGVAADARARRVKDLAVLPGGEG